MKTISLLSLALALLMTFASQSSSCTIAEIVEMVENGSGQNAIRNVCHNSVSNAPRCRFREVLDFAYSGMLDFEIAERCGLCEAPTCLTRQGECDIIGGRGRLIDGSPCTCVWPNGMTSRGLLHCNN